MSKHVRDVAAVRGFKDSVASSIITSFRTARYGGSKEEIESGEVRVSTPQQLREWLNEMSLVL